MIISISFTCTLVFSQTSGHLKFGLLEFQMLDTLADPETKALMEKRFEKSLSYDVYFNQDTLLEVRTKEELNIRYMTFYDSNFPNVVSFYLTTPEGNYFVRDSTYKSGKNEHLSKKDKKEMQKLVLIGDPVKDNKTISGIECTKVTMLNPIDRQSEYITTYLTEAIPSLVSASNPLSSFFPGFSLETTLVLDEFKVTWGAIAFEPLDKEKNVFEINTESYSHIGYEKMKELLLKYLDLP